MQAVPSPHAGRVASMSRVSKTIDALADVAFVLIMLGMLAAGLAVLFYGFLCAFASLR